ncbi:uncharacterized protein LOC131151965 [Malania oleifera]|uniref:uncharacterized protein LOC131151965 n=1 Tax=Malania oleifera TaxID=397392 RepID=UPI0025AEB849|nr:uncharacterized protein LOC131151965 [Malania oleifera]
MVVETWILKMGNQVSANLKHALLLESSKKKCSKKPEQSQSIGILSFEIANLMSKTVHLYKSLTDSEISKLKSEILKSKGVVNLVSSNESYLLELALAEKLEELDRVARAVSRLGKRCSVPALLGFEHVYGDIVRGAIDLRGLGFLVKDMEAMVRKLERYVQMTSNLYGEMETLSEMERTAKKFQHEESRRAFEQKLAWQKQDVNHLKDVSLWGQTYDKVVELLARTVCTIYARIRVVFGEFGIGLHEGGSPLLMKLEFQRNSGAIDVQSHGPTLSGPLKRVLSKTSATNSGQSERTGTNAKPQLGSQTLQREAAPFHPEDFAVPCGSTPGKLFLECFSLSSSASKIDDDLVHHDQDGNSEASGCCRVATDAKQEQWHSGSSNRSRISGLLQPMCSSANCLRFGRRSRLASYASPCTIGGSALALHYANVIIVIEKLLRYPHLVGEEARDDLYQMLPSSLRSSLRTNLKAYVKHLAIYDAPLAHDWKETLDGILSWLAPLAHNMIRWQSERNFEQQQIVTRMNVLLLQTLYFADREKTEAAICELLVGLNYICRYEQQQNALLDCASSFDFDDCVAWQS